MEDTDELLKKIKESNQKVGSRLGKINKKDPFRAKKEIEELRKELTQIKSELNKIDNYMEYDGKGDKGELRVQKGEYDSLKKKLDSLEREVTQIENLSKLKSGELKGIEREQTEKLELENQIGQIEDHGKIIDYIGKDIREANRNIEEAAINIKDQGNRIDNVTDKVDNNQVKISKAEAIENQMIRSAKCQKCALFTLAILLFLTDSILLLVLIFGKKR
jgi:chromosome segregation ATPase